MKARKLLSVLLCMVLALNLLAVTVKSANEDDPPEFSDRYDALDYLTGQMKNRAETVRFTLLIDNSEYEYGQENFNAIAYGVMDDIKEYPYLDLKDPRGGDYLELHVSSTHMGASAGNVDMDTSVFPPAIAAWRIVFTVDIVYHTDSAQEIEVDNRVRTLLDELGIANKTDYEKVVAIYDYICDNVVYDDEHLYDDTYTLKYSAYAALTEGTAVCQGYSSLLYRLLREAGVQARCITGEADGGTGYGRHAWNMIKLCGSYYLADSTWDAVYQDHTWFLKSETDFPDHDPDDEFLTADFVSSHPLAACSFEPSSVSQYTTSFTAGGNAVLGGTYTGQKVSELLPLYTGATVAMYRGGTELSPDDVIGTGNRIVAKDQDGNTVSESYVIVKGDTSGDGLTDSEDLAELARHIAGVEPLSDEFKTAAAAITGGSSANSEDLAALARYVAGVTSSLN